jgi:CRISPR/Cas system-associated exonuclease Cas4 (RecB family)
MTELEQDERKGKPSASIMPLLFKCAGAWRMKHAAPKQLSNKAAERGTAIHEALETGDDDDLDAGEKLTLEAIRAMERDAVSEWADGEEVTELREWRVWDAFQRVSGKADVVFEKSGKRFLVIDAKTGWGDVEAPARNWQLRTLAVLLYREQKATEVRVAIAKPHGKKSFTVVDYDREALIISESRLDERLMLIDHPEAPLSPGDHCGTCPGNAVCPKAQGKVTALAEQKGLTWATLPVEQKIGLYEAATLAEKIAKDIKANFRVEVEAGNVPGYEIGKGVAKRAVPDMRKLAEAIAEKLEKNVDTVLGDLSRFAKLPIGDLESVVAEYIDDVKGAKQWVNDNLNDCLEWRLAKGRIQKAKP